MKLIKLPLLVSAVLLVCGDALAWGGLGHRITIKVAERHLTAKTKANIARYMDYDLAKDAVWMDKHRKDEPIAYTTAWHVYNVDENHNYDPNPRLYKGDCLLGLKVADYNLRKYRNLSDSAVLMNLRMILHFVGDLHCPTHSYFPGPRCFWPCTLNGKPVKKFHGLYDGMPERLYGKKCDDAKIAEELDNAKKSEIKKISAGSFEDWARSCGDINCEIYRINPVNTPELDPETVEKSRKVVDIELRNGGYRLARLLNEYFGK